MGVLDWLPGFSRKASAVGDLRAGYQANRPVYTPKAGRGVDKYAEEAMQAVVAYAAVRAVAKAFAAVPWYLAREVEDGLDPVENEQWRSVWERPNAMQSGPQYRELWATFFLIYGEAVSERVVAGGTLRELFNMEPPNVGVVPGSLGYPVRYTYKAKGQERSFPVRQTNGDCDVLFVKAANPTDAWRGMAPTWAAAKAIDAFNAAGEWNAAILQNSAQPSGVLSAKDALTDNQRERLKESIEERYSGPRNAGKPLVLDGELNWQSMSLTPQEMAFVEGNRENARMVALAYGVPPMLLGIPGDNTYSNMREARLALYDDTVMPMLNLFGAEHTNWLSAYIGEDVKICPDYDAIEALDYRRERRWDRVQQADFLTIDEKRAALGYGPVGESRGGEMIASVQQYAGLTMDLDAEPEQAGRRAYGGQQ